MVPPFRPGVGKQDEHPANRAWRQRGEQEPRVIGEQANIAEAAARHLAEQPHDAVLEHLAANEADLKVTLGLLSQMLAGAKPDLEPDIADRHRKQ